jgi:hypothetical protein
MPGKRRKYEVRTAGEPGSTSGVEFSTSKEDLPLISESVKLMIKPLFEALPPERRTVNNLQDALDLTKEGWNLQIEFGDDREGLPEELATRSARFVGRGLAAETGRQLLELLMERKRKLFPSDDRVIAKAEAFVGKDGLDVMVIWGRYAKV